MIMTNSVIQESLMPVACDLCGAPPCDPFLEKLGGHYSRCSSCGFVYSSPRARDPAVYNEENNETLGEGYIAKHYSKRHQAEYARLLRSLEPYRGGGRLLEVGCSAGGFLFQARKMGWEPVGVEPVDAVARYGREKHGLNAKTCTLEEAAFPADSFDAVFSNAVLEHLPSPKSLLREAVRVLRPGGVFYADTVNFESYTQQFIGPDWKLIDPRAHLSLFSPATLRRFCEEAGFVVRAIQTRGVRFRANNVARLKGPRRWLEEIKKLPWSIAARLTLHGDSIVVIAEKPSRKA